MGGSVIAPLTGHLDAALTNFSKGYSQNELVADILFPRVPVGRQADKYWIYGQEGKELTETTLRAPGGVPQETRMSLSSAGYFCASHALQAMIPAENEANYEAGSLQQDATQDLMSKILLDKEIAAAALATATATLTQNTTLAGGDQFSDYANSKPGDVVEDAIATIVAAAGVKPNLIVCGDPVYRRLRQHPLLQDKFKYVSADKLNESHLAAFFGVDRFVVASAVKRSNAGVNSFVWGKDMVIAYAAPSAGQRDISMGKSFVWQGAPGTIGGLGVIVGQHPYATAKSKLVGVDFYYDQRVTAVEGAYLIKAAVA